VIGDTSRPYQAGVNCRHEEKEVLMLKTICKLGLILWVMLMPLSAVPAVDLPWITNPEALAVAGNRLLLLEGTTIHLLELPGGKYLGKFGQEGEGPGEIRKNPFGGPILVMPHQDKIFVNSMARLSVFSRDGVFIEEFRIDPNDNFIPFGEQFVCMGPYVADGRPLMSLFITGSNLQKDKPIYVSDFEIGMDMSFEFPITPFYPAVNRDQLFIIAGKDGFAIDVYNRQGQKLYRIEKKEPAVALSAEYRTETEKAFKRNPNFASLWDYFRQRIKYKSHFPAIFDFFVEGDRIYAFTNKMRAGERECLVMDLKGKELKRIYLPVPMNYGLEFKAIYTIASKVFYHLVEDEERETWTLRTRIL
jgi:hypothetical protein